MSKDPDPTKDPEFQKVVRHFLTTPHKPHAKMKLGKPRAKRVKSPKKKDQPKQ